MRPWKRKARRDARRTLGEGTQGDLRQDLRSQWGGSTPQHPFGDRPKGGCSRSVWADRQLERPGTSQKEDQKRPGEVKGGGVLRLLGSPGPLGLPSGSSLASLEFHQTIA